MYKKKQRIISDETELSNYIDGFDIYNSLIIQKLADPSLQREFYEITVHEFRPDLIAEDFYGDPDYMGLLLIQVRVPITSLRRGVVLKLLPKETVDSIISNL